MNENDDQRTDEHISGCQKGTDGPQQLLENMISLKNHATVTGQHQGQSDDVGRGGALVKSMTLNQRVVGSTPALAAT